MVQRRQFLTLGAGLLSGCAGPIASDTDSASDAPSRSPSTTEGTATATDAETGTDSPTPARYAGGTIPHQPTDRSRAPLTPEPIDGVENPILTGDDVTDYGDVDYVADPFLFVEAGTYHLFFEVVNGDRTPDAVIGHATASDPSSWEYQGVVLAKDAHTSFPLTWKAGGRYYMTPPTGKDVELWTTDEASFPGGWEFSHHLIDRDYYSHDPVVFWYRDRWWLATDRGNTDLMLSHSPTLDREGWTPHEGNPVAVNRHGARQGGRAVVTGGTPHLFTQDLREMYGEAVHGWRVTELTPTTFEYEHAGVVLEGSGEGWNALRMHQYDPWPVAEDRWLCAVDGARDTGPSWAIGLYEFAPS